jgi:hypothetical protein
MDGTIIKDAVIRPGDLSRLYSEKADFSSSDAGKVIAVRSAGADGALHVCHIDHAGDGCAVLSEPAESAVTREWAVFGTDCTASIQEAVNRAIMEHSHRAVAEPGRYVSYGMLAQADEDTRTRAENA